MKVLWISLVEFPPLSNALGGSIQVHCGWLYSSAKAALDEITDLRLGVLVYSHSKHYARYEIEGITYYLIPSRSIEKSDCSQINNCIKAIEDFEPDFIHVHGTEYSLAEAVCKANNHKRPIIANIQGLAGPYMRYADGGLSYREKLINITLLDFLRGTFILRAKKSFFKRSQCENYVLRNLTHIIGRTQWDRAHVSSINPKLKYHSMNETLRDSFYEEPIWSYSNCTQHSIFVSNSGTALKGAHQVVKALPIILKAYPDTMVRLCGSNVMNSDIRSLIKMQGYHLYLRRLVKRLNLENNVCFLGQLTEEEMKHEYLKANVYVMPSAIENSPNSLCEAQILGVPAVASMVGGVPDLLKDGKTGYVYRYEEVEMLAQIVIQLFSQTDFTLLSKQERYEALKRHNKKNNALRLKQIYDSLIR